jgi:hypothetical protein
MQLVLELFVGLSQRAQEVVPPHSSLLIAKLPKEWPIESRASPTTGEASGTVPQRHDHRDRFEFLRPVRTCLPWPARHTFGRCHGKRPLAQICTTLWLRREASSCGSRSALRAAAGFAVCTSQVPEKAAMAGRPAIRKET